MLTSGSLKLQQQRALASRAACFPPSHPIHLSSRGTRNASSQHSALAARASNKGNNSSSSSSSSSSVRPDAGDEDDSDGGAFGDKWENTLAVHHTLSSLYTPQVTLQPFQQIDHAAKRRERELGEICEAGCKLGLSEPAIRSGAASLEGLVPGLAPNLDKMKASEWAKLLAEPNGVVAVVIALRTSFPSADIGVMVSRQPKLLLKCPEELREKAERVISLLSPSCPNVDYIIQEVPDVMEPRELEQALSNLRRCFPQEDPLALLQSDPSILRNIGGEVDIEADPSYGLPTNDPTAFWPALGPGEG